MEEPSHTTNPSRFLLLSRELRFIIYDFLLPVPRPFLIGRLEDDTLDQYDFDERSPRDYHVNSKPPLRRNNERHRPVQPPITRTSRLTRQESLPMFYSLNHFWLIHNEFQPWPEHLLPANLPEAGKWHEVEFVDLRRGFHPWLQQTPRNMFNYMQHVSLCGYIDWPDRIMIHINLKTRSITGVKHYNTYGDELGLPPTGGYLKEQVRRSPAQQEWLKEKQAALDGKREGDGFEALGALLEACDKIWRIVDDPIGRPRGTFHRRREQIQEGWEFDW